MKELKEMSNLKNDLFRTMGKMFNPMKSFEYDNTIDGDTDMTALYADIFQAILDGEQFQLIVDDGDSEFRDILITSHVEEKKWSCCGDEMDGDSDLCPTCLEHC